MSSIFFIKREDIKMADLTKELIQEMLVNLSGKTEEGIPKSVMSSTNGYIENNEFKPQATIPYENCVLTVSVDQTLPTLLNLTVETSDTTTINMLWARYRAFKQEQSQGKAVILGFDILGAIPYINENDEYDEPLYAKLSACNPVIASTSKSVLDLERDDTISFLIPMEQVFLETFKEEVLEQTEELEND